MTLLYLIITLVVVGLILWAINNFIPMDGKIKTLLNVVVIVVLLFWLLSALNVLPILNRPITGG